MNAEMMHQGVALPISDIRPDNNIESEIFPPELTKEAQNKEVFTPPNHQQMRFHGGTDHFQKSDIEEEEQNFFITEDIRPQQEPIKEENESEHQDNTAH